MSVNHAITITNTMRTAAKGVAVSHQHYVANCEIMATLKGKEDAMVVAIQERKKAHTAYHMALGFLRESTRQANPSLVALDQHPNAQDIASQVDDQLNQLITHADGDPKYEHRVIRENENWRWN